MCSSQCTADPQFEHNISEEAQMDAKDLGEKGSFPCIELPRVQGKERGALICNTALKSTPVQKKKSSVFCSSVQKNSLVSYTLVQLCKERGTQHSSVKKGELSAVFQRKGGSAQ